MIMLRCVLNGTLQLSLPVGTTGAEWFLMLYIPEKAEALQIFGTIDPFELRQWTESRDTGTDSNHKRIVYLNKKRQEEGKQLTDHFIRCLRSSESNIFRYENQIGVRAKGCCLRYNVRETDAKLMQIAALAAPDFIGPHAIREAEEKLRQLPLDEIVKYCSQSLKMSKDIAEWLAAYPAPKKGLVPPLRRFLSNLLELLPILSELEQEEPQAQAITSTPTEVTSDNTIADAVSTVSETEAAIELQVNLPEVSETSKAVTNETVPDATNIQNTSQAETAVTVEDAGMTKIREAASTENVSPVNDLLELWERLLIEQGEAKSGRRDFIQQIKNLLEKDMEANSASLLLYLGNEESVGASAREILALTLIEMLPLSLLSAFLPRVSISLLLSCVRRSPVAYVMQSLSDSLSLRLMERLLRTYYGQTPFAEAQEILDAMRELMTLAQEEDRPALRWRFFHALTETCARAREFAHLSDSQGSTGFLEWIQRSLLPSLSLEERLQIGTALVQNVLTFDLPTQGVEPMYPIFRNLLSQMTVDKALHEMLTLPHAHKAAFWQYLIN